MIACFFALYAGLLFYQPNQFASYVLLLAEIGVIVLNASYYFYAISELVYDYAANMSDNPKFIHRILKFQSCISILSCQCYRGGNSKLNALHDRLKSKLRKEFDESIMLHKLRGRAQTIKEKAKIHVKNKNKTAVVPSNSFEVDAKRKANAFWNDGDRAHGT